MLKNLNVIEYAKRQGLDDVLTYRPTAKKMFEDALNNLHLLMSGDVLNCSFECIDMCDASFADEFVINFQKYLIKYENTMMIVSNANDCVQENLNAALSLRNRQDHSKVCLLLFVKNDYIVFGDLEKNLQETFDQARKKGELTAREIAKQFNIEINSASNRLKKLFDLRLLLRREMIDESGRQHMYYLPSKK